MLEICKTRDVVQKLNNTLRSRQNGRHFADDIFKCIFWNENVWIHVEHVKISLKFVPKGPISNISAFGSDNGLPPSRWDYRDIYASLWLNELMSGFFWANTAYLGTGFLSIHEGLVTYLCFSELGQIWFRKTWLVACTAWNHYLNQCLHTGVSSIWPLGNNFS